MEIKSYQLDATKYQLQVAKREREAPYIHTYPLLTMHSYPSFFPCLSFHPTELYFQRMTSFYVDFYVRSGTKNFASQNVAQLVAFFNALLLLLTMMKTLSTALILSLAAVTSAVELTPDNWDSEVAGKTVFIKFQAPW